MEWKYMRGAGIALVAALALGLAGCGGGGSDTPPPGDDAGMMDDKDDMTASACETSMTSAACVAEKKMAADDAMDAYEAAKADGSATNAQVKDAMEAYEAAKMAYEMAKQGRDEYLAMQTPTFDPKAMAAALASGQGSGLTFADVVTGGKIQTAYSDDYNAATWPVPSIASFKSNAFQLKDGGVTESIVSYTNAQAARSARWSDYYKLDASSAWVTSPLSGYDYKPQGTGLDSTAAVGTGGALTIDVSGELSKAASKLFKASALPTGKSTTKNYTTDAAKKFAGSFNGVAGEYQCTGTCSVSLNAKGDQLTFVGTSWTFTPTSTSTRIAGVLVDKTYLDFGYWVQTEKVGDDTVYTVEAFAHGKAAAGDPTAVEGTATYKGGAGGVYVRNTFDTAGKATPAASGRFTAAAELMASFGDASAIGTIRGTISDFKDGEATIDPSWRVSLPQTAITDGSGADGTNFDYSASGQPSWSGTFYGADADTAKAPHGVSGTFKAGLHNGRVNGAFGANRQN